MKKSFLFALIIAALVSSTGTGCKKEGLVAPAPVKKTNLTIETVSGPTKEDCGGFDWKVKFNLNEASKGGGWIVQKVIYTRNIVKCPDLRFKNDSKTYWEAWRVTAGAKGDSDRLAGRFTFDDQFSSPNYPDTKGGTTVKGEVRFFEGVNLPADFKTNNADTYAGGLPATTTKPAFWDATNAADHNLSYFWNCCVNPKTGTLTVTPDDKKTAMVIPADMSKLDETGKLIFKIPTWIYGYNTEFASELITIARQVKNSTSPSSLFNSLMNYEKTFAGTSNYVEQMSKVYLLLRVLYQLPNNMNSSNARVFGGWIHPSIGNSSFDMAWPVTVAPSTSGLEVNVDTYDGFLGRGYDAAAEFDYFESNFPKRNL